MVIRGCLLLEVGSSRRSTFQSLLVASRTPAGRVDVYVGV